VKRPWCAATASLAFFPSLAANCMMHLYVLSAWRRLVQGGRFLGPVLLSKAAAFSSITSSSAQLLQLGLFHYQTGQPARDRDVH
jgi:hypothetical protein